MKHWGTQKRLLIITLLPGLIIAVALGGYFSFERHQQLQDHATAQAILLSRQLAIHSSELFNQANPSQVALSDYLNLPQLRALALLNNKQEIIITVGPQMLAPSSKRIIEYETHRFYTANSLRIQAPIFSQGDPLHSQLLGWVELEFHRELTTIAQYKSLLISLLLVIAAGLLALYFAYLASTRITRPMKHAATALTQLENGNFESRIPLSEQDEFSELTHIINSMAASLQRAQQEQQDSVEQATQDLKETMEEMEVQNIELNLARKEALNASKTKSDFLANMSHEIRTPLNGILGFTDMLLRDDERTTEEDRAQWLGIIQSSGQHLLQLINNILDISKVESGEIDLEMTPCDLTSTLTYLASVMRIHATDKMIDLKVESSGRLPKSIITDPTRFRQILTNLVANAIKFTDTGSVTMRTHLRDTGDEQVAIIIEIIDTGMGIPEDKLESIFEPFSQAESSITRNFGGTGLGLTISRNLTMAMGGTLCVSSIEGAGSTFTVSLPIGRASEIEYQEDSQNESAHCDQAPITKKSVKDRLSGHVLLVDDGQTNRQLISLILKRAGAKVTTANNGQEGFDRATKTDFDLILMDMQMPIMDGYTASTMLREHGITTPIIALTASAMARDRKRCIGAGCSDYLTKPVNIEELIDHAAQWMNNPKALSQADDETDTTRVSPQTSSALVSTLPMDDPELREIVLSYIESLPEQLTDIELAHENENYLLLSSIVHKFIGLGGMVGLEPLTVAAIALKECVLCEEFEEIAHAIAELRDITARAQRGAMELPPLNADPS